MPFYIWHIKRNYLKMVWVHNGLQQSEGSCIYVLGVSLLTLFTIFLFNFGTVPTVWNFCSFPLLIPFNWCIFVCLFLCFDPKKTFLSNDIVDLEGYCHIIQHACAYLSRTSKSTYIYYPIIEIAIIRTSLSPALVFIIEHC
jgi:hypothetical protein